MGLFLFFVFLSALINIILVLALGTTEHIALSACGKDLLTMLAQLYGTVLVRQHEAEHHLSAQQQRMEIPNDGRLVKQGDVVSGSHAAECCHAHVQRLFRFIFQRSIVLVVEKTGQQMECPIFELRGQPVVPLRILPLETHIHSHTPIIYEFIDKIIVHAPDKSSGERVQEVEIYLKFIGKFDVPMPEPTPEELEAMEKEQQRRAYNREKGRRQRERQKQRREAAKVTEAQTKNTPEEATT